MRVTKDVQAATREKILRAAAELFKKKGWQRASTREIARRAKVASGTVFNYFPTKEAIAAALVNEAMQAAEDEFHSRRKAGQTLEEDLFLFIWFGLRQLAPYRNFLITALETLLSPLARSSPEHHGEAVRLLHVDAVERIISRRKTPQALSHLSLQVYWTLYLGVLAFWAADDSPNHEDTMAMVDHSVRLFVASLAGAQRKRSAGERSVKR